MAHQLVIAGCFLMMILVPCLSTLTRDNEE